MRKRLPYLLPVAILLLLAAIVRQHGQIPYPDVRYIYSDHYRYLAMARQPFGGSPLAHDPPYCWRVLTPLLVHFLPVTLTQGFWILTLTGLSSTVLALQWFLRGLDLPSGACVAGGLAFVVLGPAVGFCLWDDLLVDPLALFFLVLACGYAVRHNGRMLLVVAVVGSLAKETMLLGALFAIAWAWTHRDWVLLRWAALAITMVFIELILLRLAIAPSRPYSLISEAVFVLSFGIPSAVQSDLLGLALGLYLLLRLLMATIGAWGALLPLALLHIRFAPPKWRSHGIAFGALLVTAAAQVFVSVAVERVVIYAFPAMIAIACCAVEGVSSRTHISRWIVWVPILAVQLYVLLPYAGWRSISSVFPPVFVTDLDAPHVWTLGVLSFATICVGAWMYLDSIRDRVRQATESLNLVHGGVKDTQT